MRPDEDEELETARRVLSSADKLLNVLGLYTVDRSVWSAEEAAALPAPPMVPLPRPVQVLRFNQRQIEFVFKARRALGEVWRMHAYRDEDVVTSHPDHVRSLFTARPEHAPSLTGESPLRPIVGPNSVLTAVGPRHMRQRKLLLPPFQGSRVSGFRDVIRDVAEREVAQALAAGALRALGARRSAAALLRPAAAGTILTRRLVRSARISRHRPDPVLSAPHAAARARGEARPCNMRRRIPIA